MNGTVWGAALPPRHTDPFLAISAEVVTPKYWAMKGIQPSCCLLQLEGISSDSAHLFLASVLSNFPRI